MTTKDSKPNFWQKIFMGWDKFEIIMLLLGAALILGATLIFGEMNLATWLDFTAALLTLVWVPAAASARYCTHCGAAVLKEAVVCPKCGCPLTVTPTTGAENGTSLQVAAKVFMVISCVGFALLACIMMISAIMAMANEFFLIVIIIYLVPLFWAIPMTENYFKAVKNHQPVSTGFKVCTLLFVNLIAGILMLCDTSNNQQG